MIEKKNEIAGEGMTLYADEKGFEVNIKQDDQKGLE